jgi:hypothetical protein
VDDLEGLGVLIEKEVQHAVLAAVLPNLGWRLLPAQPRLSQLGDERSWCGGAEPLGIVIHRRRQGQHSLLLLFYGGSLVRRGRSAVGRG